MADGESNWGWVAAAVAGLLGVAGAVVAYNCGHSDGYEDGLGDQNEDFERKYAELRDAIAKEKNRANKAIKKLQRIKSNYLELVKWAYDNGGMTKEEFDYFKNTVESELDLEGQERISRIRSKISECIDGLCGESRVMTCSLNSDQLISATPIKVSDRKKGIYARIQEIGEILLKGEILDKTTNTLVPLSDGQKEEFRRELYLLNSELVSIDWG